MGKKNPKIETRKNRSNSNSSFQTKMEKELVRKLEEELNLSDLGNDTLLSFKGDASSKIKPDIYSSKHHIIGEIYTPLGKLKSSQMDKVTSDILKMILFEEDSGSKDTIVYIVCDEAVMESMLGNAVIKNACRLHNIIIKCYPLDEPLKSELKRTMIRQNITI